MAPKVERPNFFDAWLEDLLDDRRRYGAHKLIPWWLLGSAGIGATVAYTVPSSFWIRDPSIPVTFYGAILTVNGLLLALCWSSFAKIYETASAPGFADFLQDHKLLRHYFFFVDFIQITQIIALIVSGGALGLSLYDDIPLVWRRIALLLTVMSLLYALRYAAGSVRLMQDLVWYRRIFDGRRNGDNDNIVRLPESG